jgi:peptide deformylase
MLSRPARPFVLPDEAAEVTRITERLFEVADRVRARFEFLTGAMGLAAPQIGEPRAVAVFRPNVGPAVVLINPELRAVGPAVEEASEGCLSFYEFRFVFERPRAVAVRHRTLAGEIVTTGFRGRDARDVHHEVDHLRGVLCLDHVTPGSRAVFIE